MSAVLAQRSRRTQAQRSDATRTKLLDAAVDLLADVGYAQLTTTAVAERAGVSRGAELHHFRTRTDLVAATVRHVSRLRGDRLRLTATGGSGADREAALDLLAGAYQGRVFVASLELWVAARTDAALREVMLPAERDLDENLLGLCRRLLGTDDVPQGWQLDEVTLDLLRGVGVGVLLSSEGDASARWRRLLDGWQRILGAAEPGHRAGVPAVRQGRRTATVAGKAGATSVGRVVDI